MGRGTSVVALSDSAMHAKLTRAEVISGRRRILRYPGSSLNAVEHPYGGCWFISGNLHA